MWPAVVGNQVINCCFSVTQSSRKRPSAEFTVYTWRICTHTLLFCDPLFACTTCRYVITLWADKHGTVMQTSCLSFSCSPFLFHTSTHTHADISLGMQSALHFESWCKDSGEASFQEEPRTRGPHHPTKDRSCVFSPRSRHMTSWSSFPCARSNFNWCHSVLMNALSLKCENETSWLWQSNILWGTDVVFLLETEASLGQQRFLAKHRFGEQSLLSQINLFSDFHLYFNFFTQSFS